VAKNGQCLGKINRKIQIKWNLNLTNYIDMGIYSFKFALLRKNSQKYLKIAVLRKTIPQGAG